MNKPHCRSRIAHGVLAGTFLMLEAGAGWAQTTAPTALPTAATKAASPTPASPASPAASPTAAGKSTTPGTGKAPKTGVSPTAITVPPGPTTATPPPPIVVNVVQAAPAKEEPSSNNWAPGLIGLVLLGTLGFFGYRYAKGRGMTVAGTLQQIGVEMPQDGVNGAGQVQPLRPVAPPAPPLPPLADLPSATSSPATSFAPPPSTPSPLAGIPRLVGLAGPVAGELFEVAQGLTIGRDGDNHVPLAEDTTVSRRHARVEAAPSGGFQVSDLGSSNGTFLNGQRVSGTQVLSPGDTLQIGAARLRFEA